MVGQFSIQKILSEQLWQTRLRNPSYSMRAFARKLQLSSGALSTILNGKRQISPKMAIRISDKLCLDPKQKKEFLSSFSPSIADDPLSLRYTQLSLDQFNMISEWYHFAIISLIQTKNFRSDVRWIAKRLNIKLYEVRSALKRLQRLGVIGYDPKGNLHCKELNYATSDGILNTSLRKSHAQNLELARRSLERDSIEKRDFSAMTMAINPDKLQEAKQRIRTFLDEMSLLLETEPKKEVYKLCVQLIPLTQKEGRK